MEIPPARNPKEVKQFLRIVSYYHSLISCFADIARLLISLTKKKITFNWTKQFQEEFQFLKERFIKEPILKYPNPKKLYVLFTDASKYAWVCVLTQSDEHGVDGKKTEILHPITYMSGLFHGNQIN